MRSLVNGSAHKHRQYAETLKQQVTDRTVSLENSLSLVKSTFESSSDGLLVLIMKAMSWNIIKNLSYVPNPIGSNESHSEEKY